MGASAETRGRGDADPRGDVDARTSQDEGRQRDADEAAENQLLPTNVRTIFRSEFQRQGDEWIYSVAGSGFLHHMVRNLVGTSCWWGREH